MHTHKNHMCVFVREQSNFFNILDNPECVYNVSCSDSPSTPSPPQHDLLPMHPLSVITFGVSAATGLLAWSCAGSHGGSVF